MNFITKSQALAKVEKPTLHPVEIEELGGFVNIKAVSTKDQIDFEAAKFKAEKDGVFFDQVVELVSKCVCDQEGKLLFDSEDGRKILSELPNSALRKMDLAIGAANVAPKMEEFFESLKKIRGEGSILDSVIASESPIQTGSVTTSASES